MEYCSSIKQEPLIALRYTYYVNCVQDWWGRVGMGLVLMAPPPPLSVFLVAPKTSLTFSFNP